MENAFRYILVLSGAKKLGEGDYNLGQKIINSYIKNVLDDVEIHLIDKQNIKDFIIKTHANITIINQNHNGLLQDQYYDNDELTSHLVQELFKIKHAIKEVSFVTVSGGMYDNFGTKFQRRIKKIYSHKLTKYLEKCNINSSGGTGGMAHKIKSLVKIKKTVNSITKMTCIDGLLNQNLGTYII